MNQSSEKHRVMVAMLGARRHYAVPASLNSAGALEHLYTDICAVKGWPRIVNYIPETMRPAPLKRLAGRIPRGVPLGKLTSFPELGLSYAYRLSRAKSLDEQVDIFKKVGDWFADRIDRCGFGEADTVYIFDHNALGLIRKAKSLGLKTVVDVTVAPFSVDQTILAEERERFPGWESSVQIPHDETVKRVNDLDLEAWDLADLLICGSQYVKNCVVEAGAAAEKCVVIPYGMRTLFNTSRPSRKWSGRLKVLSVGTVCLRKGAPYIMEVAKRMKDYASFRVVGPINLNEDAVKEMARHVNLVGQVPRTSIMEHYEWADVFLLPSLSEGSAAATYEALAYGLPVICTPNTGSVVRDGVDGFVVKPRDVDAIVERLVQLYSSHSLRESMAMMATQNASCFTLDRYGQNLASAITALHQGPDGTPVQ